MAELRVREAPDVAEHQAVLGASYVEPAARPMRSPPQAALRLNDRTAGTSNYLGVALMAQGRVADAAAHFRRAAALGPRDERIHFNLGNALAELSRYPEAVAAYERALAVNPDFPDAHVNLGLLLLARPDAGHGAYERAVAPGPDSAVIHNTRRRTGRDRPATEARHVQRSARSIRATAWRACNLKR